MQLIMSFQVALILLIDKEESGNLHFFRLSPGLYRLLMILGAYIQIKKILVTINLTISVLKYLYVCWVTHS